MRGACPIEPRFTQPGQREYPLLGPAAMVPTMADAFRPLRCAVVTVSDTRTEQTDRSGALIAQRLADAGHQIARRRIIRDDLEELSALFGALVADAEVEVVLATGGTGITGRDITPEALAPHVSKEIPGFGELFRWLSYEDIGTSTIQSRATAALCDRTLVFLLPGSTGACTLAMDRILLEQLDARHKPCNFVTLLPRLAEGA